MTQPPSSDAPRASLSSRVVGSVLRSPIGRRLGRSLVLLRVRGRHSGARFEFPVQYASTEGGIVVVPGRPETKQWWRNLREPSPIEVLRNGSWHHARALVLAPADDAYGSARDDYLERWSRMRLSADAPIVLVTWLDERDLATVEHDD